MSESLSMGNIIRQRREELGLSQVELGRALGIASGEFICMVETGKRHFALENVPRLAAVLCLDAEDLCRCALWEAAPSMYRSTFGDVAPQPPKRLIRP
jgi:transcriptional regulator with XRE-family HTH domain